MRRRIRTLGACGSFVVLRSGGRRCARARGRGRAGGWWRPGALRSTLSVCLTGRSTAYHAACGRAGRCRAGRMPRWRRDWRPRSRSPWPARSPLPEAGLPEGRGGGELCGGGEAGGRSAGICLSAVDPAREPLTAPLREGPPDVLRAPRRPAGLRISRQPAHPHRIPLAACHPPCRPGTVLSVEGGPGFATTGSEADYLPDIGPLHLANPQPAAHRPARHRHVHAHRTAPDSEPAACAAAVRDGASTGWSAPAAPRLNDEWRYRGGGWMLASEDFNTAYSARDVARSAAPCGRAGWTCTAIPTGAGSPRPSRVAVIRACCARSPWTPLTRSSASTRGTPRLSSPPGVPSPRPAGLSAAMRSRYPWLRLDPDRRAGWPAGRAPSAARPPPPTAPGAA